MAKIGNRITAKQKVARIKNIAIARKAKGKGGRGRGKLQQLNSELRKVTGSNPQKGTSAMMRGGKKRYSQKTASRNLKKFLTSKKNNFPLRKGKRDPILGNLNELV